MITWATRWSWGRLDQFGEAGVAHQEGGGGKGRHEPVDEAADVDDSATNGAAQVRTDDGDGEYPRRPVVGLGEAWAPCAHLTRYFGVFSRRSPAAPESCRPSSPRFRV
jgi:hypothetical protein